MIKEALFLFTEGYIRLMIRVLHIVTAFPRSDDEHSMTPWLVSLLKGLKERGVESTILAPSYKGLGDQVVQGISVRRFRYFIKDWETLTHDEATPVKLSRKPWYITLVPFMLFFGIKKMKKLIKLERFDLVHVHWPIPMAIIALPAVGKIPIVMEFYGAEMALVRRNILLKYFAKWIAKRGDYCIAISSYTASLVRDITGITPVVIPYACDFPTKVNKPVFPEKKSPKNLLFVGRLVERKGVEYLIRAIPYIRREIDVRLKIIGGGPLLNNLKELAKQLKVDDIVEFSGIVSNEEKDKAYRECDLFILPACFDKKGDTEGLGVVLLEALSYGKPVIASSVGGIVDIVKNGKTGILVKEKEPKEIARAVLKLLSDKNLYLKIAENGYNFVKENFSIEKIAEQTYETYKNLLDAI